MARWLMVGIFALVSAVSVMSSVYVDMPVLKVVSMSDTLFQALLLASMITSLVAPRRVKMKCVLLQIFLILLIVGNLWGSLLYYPQYFNYSLALYEVFFAWQIVGYGRKCSALLREAGQKLNSTYEDDESRFRLSPIYNFLYSGIIMGVVIWVGFLFPFADGGFNVLVLVYTLYYIWLCIVMIRYRVQGDYFIKVLFEPERKPQEVPLAPVAKEAADAVGLSQPQEDVKSEKTAPIYSHYDKLEEELRRWTEHRGYIDNDVTVEQLADQMGVTRNEFITYFQQVHNTTFRSWRLRLRLEEAERLIRNTPGLRVSALYELVGFNDRSNFHNKFTEFTGLTPVAYQQQFGPK